MIKRPVLQGDIEAIATVASFLVHLERDHPHMYYGAHRIDEAIEALAHLVGCPADRLRLVGNAGSKVKG